MVCVGAFAFGHRQGQEKAANEAAILRLRVLQGQSLRAVGRELGICSMTVSCREKAAPAAMREQLA